MADKTKAELYQEWLQQGGQYGTGLSFDMWLTTRPIQTTRTNVPTNVNTSRTTGETPLDFFQWARKYTNLKAPFWQKPQDYPEYKQYVEYMMNPPNTTTDNSVFRPIRPPPSPIDNITPITPKPTYTPTTTDLAYQTYLKNGGKKSYEEWLIDPSDDGDNDSIPTYEDWYDEDGYLHHFDAMDGWAITGYDPSRATNKTKTGADPTKLPTDPAPDGMEWYWDGDQYALRWKEPADISNADALARQQASDEAAARRQAEMIAWYKEQQANELRMQKEKDLANLRTNPKSWLEYAALAGETPVIQPWMLPLQPQDSGWRIGQALPGWTGDNTQSLQGQLPTLLNPAAQYMARIGPTAKQQYVGYQQAGTGANEEETDFRLWSTAPPSGQNRGLAYQQ